MVEKVVEKLRGDATELLRNAQEPLKEIAADQIPAIEFLVAQINAHTNRALADALEALNGGTTRQSELIDFNAAIRTAAAQGDTGELNRIIDARITELLGRREVPPESGGGSGGRGEESPSPTTVP